MAIYGQDIDQVRQLATQLNAKASDIEGVISHLTSAINSVQWMGPDAERFKSDWQGQYVPQLRQVVTALQNASQNASRNAAEQ
ncbi:MAG TPA: WXG100 family type VII secretion target, partial [Mycobacterium sp.]|nr:WXG100 family type VII secretion target [Mycobacterium sp.]